MRYYFTFLICCLLLAFASCSKSEQPTASIAPQSATPQTSLVSASPANQPGQPARTVPVAQSNGSKIDACALLTSKEIESVQGEALKETKLSGRSEGGFAISQCFYTLPTFTNSVSLIVAQKGDSAGAREPKDFWKETFHRADESQKERKKNKDKDKDKAKGQEEEGESAPPEKIAGVGDEAYWTGNRVGGAMYALNGNSYIRISIGGPGDQAAKIKKTKALAQMVLKRL